MSITKKTAPDQVRLSAFAYRGIAVATTQPKRRKSTDPSTRKQVKTSLLVDVELHAKWSAAASLSGVDRNAFAVGVLTEALKGVFIIDRRKTLGRVVVADPVESNDRESAA